MLDYSKGALALYLQIKQILREKIISGQYQLGAYIPTESQLEQTYGVSKITIRKAIQHLEDEGYLVKKSGKGTIVVQNHYFNKLAKTKSYSQKLAQLGITLAKKSASCEQLDAQTIPELTDSMTGLVHVIKRQLYADGAIFAYLETYIPFDAPLGIDFNQADWSLYRALSDLGITVERSEDFFLAVVAGVEVAAKLDIAQGVPLLKRIRKAYGVDKRLIEYSISYYLTEKNPYIIEMEK